MSLEVVHSHSHGSGFVLLQVLLWSDYPGVWEQRPVTLPELLDVTLVVHDLQYDNGSESTNTGRKFCMLQKLTLALNLVNRQNIFHSWRLLEPLLGTFSLCQSCLKSLWIPRRQFWLFNCESFSSDVPVRAVKLELWECASYVVVDEEVNPRFWVVQSGQALQELLHEGSCVFDENGDVDQRHLFVLNTQTHTWSSNTDRKTFPPHYVLHWEWCRHLTEEEQVVVANPTAGFIGPYRGDVVTEVVQLQLQRQADVW